MSELRPQPVGIPTGHPSPASEPYWDGCRIGELRYQRCSRCGSVNLKPAAWCIACGGPTLEWQRSEGQGRLYSWTVVWRPQHPAFEVPYAPAIVELDEGFWLLSSIIGCEADALRADLRVAVEFHAASDVITLPYFRPAS